MYPTISKKTSCRMSYMGFAFLMAAFTSSCTRETIPSGEEGAGLDNTIKVNVYGSGFTDTSSRVANSGNKTTFEEGDVLGLIITEEGTTYNLPYRYNGTEWMFDDTKGKEYFVRTTSGETGYIAYFPYSAEADGVTTAEDLKSKFAINPDQSTMESHEASDLMYFEGKTSNNQIDATLAHAYSLFSFTPVIKVNEAGYPAKIDNLTLTIDGNEYKPVLLGNGEYRAIIPAGTQTAEWKYRFDGAGYKGTRSGMNSAASNRYSTSEVITAVTHTPAVGDYLCRNTDGTSCVLPKGLNLYWGDMQKVGNVFKLGAGKGDTKESYTGTAIAENGIQGYAVAFQDLGGTNWAKTKELGEAAITNSDESLFDGYSNLQIIKQGNLADYPAFHKCVSFTPAAPSNSSGWYMPSLAQLAELFVCNGSLDKPLSGWYWSSTQKKDGENIVKDTAVLLEFDKGGAGLIGKNNSFNVRPVLTF